MKDNEVYNLSKKSTKFAVMDVEMTPSQLRQKMIQWSIVLIKNGEIVGQESGYVNPNCPIDSKISQLTGITDEMLQEAPKFSEIYTRLKHLLCDAVVVGQNIKFDLKILNEELQAIDQEPLRVSGWIDTVEWSRIMYPRLLSYRLQDLAHALDIPLLHVHQADADALATARLFLRLFSDWQALSLGVKKRLVPILHTLNSSFSQITKYVEQQNTLSETEYQVFTKGCIFPKTHIKQTFFTERYFFYEIKEKLQNQAFMTHIFPGYVYRPEQVEFFSEILEAWEEGTAQAFEVQPGIGKTFAYLLAGLSVLDDTYKQLMITTSTKHLQSQIENEQIPLAEKFFQRKISVTILKGARNYLCLKKFMHQLTTHDEPYELRITKAQILVWLQTTKTGDMDELNLSPNGERFFSLCSCTPNCCHSLSLKNNNCFYLHALSQSTQSDVLIVNHAVFAQNLLKENNDFFKKCKIIVDEAHELEKNIARIATSSLDFPTVFFYFSQMGRKGSGKLLDHHFSALKKYDLYHAQSAWQLQSCIFDLRQIFSLLHQNPNLFFAEKDMNGLLLKLGQYLQCLQTERQSIETLCTNLQEMMPARDQKNWISFCYYLRQLEQCICNLQVYMQNSTHLIQSKGCTKDVQDICYSVTDFQLIQQALRYFKQRLSQIVFCSGTLFVYGRDHFFLEGLDAKEKITVRSIGEVQAYKNLTVYLPIRKKVFPITVEDIRYKVHLAVQFLLERQHKKILILCNSKEMVDDLYLMLSSMEQLYDYELLAQGKSSGSKEKLYQMFKSMKKGLLLGSHSFYEGVDFPDESCTAVILPTLPFLSPNHTYVKIRQVSCNLIDPLVFIKIILPSALLMFRQALGRLKRGSHVKKDFILLDERILSRAYKKLFLQTIEAEQHAKFLIPSEKKERDKESDESEFV